MDKSPTSDNNDADEKVDTGQTDRQIHVCTVHSSPFQSNDNRQTMPDNSNKIHSRSCSGRTSTSTSTTRATWINISLVNSTAFRLIFPNRLVLSLNRPNIRFVDAYRWIQLTHPSSHYNNCRHPLCGHSAQINYRSDYIDIIFPSIN